MRLRAFALVPGVDRRAVPDREVRRFDEGPAQMPVAALGIAAAFALAVGENVNRWPQKNFTESSWLLEFFRCGSL